LILTEQHRKENDPVSPVQTVPLPLHLTADDTPASFLHHNLTFKSLKPPRVEAVITKQVADQKNNKIVPDRVMPVVFDCNQNLLDGLSKEVAHQWH
jgi:hypothetical protein